jgi:hypothetical protein
MDTQRSECAGPGVALPSNGGFVGENALLALNGPIPGVMLHMTCPFGYVL